MATITIQPSPGYDTYLDGSVHNGNYSTSTEIRIGGRSDDGPYRTLIKMDLSSIPKNAIIKSAKLYITVSADYASQTGTISVYRVLRNWVLTEATWNKYSSASSWQTAGATGAQDIDTSFGAWGSCATGSADAVDTVRTITLNTTEFTKFINGTYNNYGWLLRTTGAYHDVYAYYSANYATTASKRPKLVIDFRYPGGEPVSVSPFFNFFKSFENPWLKKGNLWQPQISEGI